MKRITENRMEINMRKIKIVVDSSADLLTLQGIAFGVAPLKIITKEKEFTDDATLDASDMVKWFDSYSGTSKTSCPSTGDWLEAFEDYDEIYCVTITSGLSGSYNSACVAKKMYETENPGRKVLVIDSLSAGPELVLIVEKLEKFIGQNMPFEDICREVEKYQQKTGLVFVLESLKNFAANGRVSPVVAKMAGILNIRVVGKASDTGTLEPVRKCRGEIKSLKTIINHLKENGLSRGKVRIAHCENEGAASKLEIMIKEAFHTRDIKIHACRGLCSYYAEKGGLLVGFEKM